MQLRLIVISDTHMQHAQFTIPDGDILIHCGDALGRGTMRELVYFNEWLATLPHKHKIFVPGNHDEVFEQEEEAARKALTNAICLINQGVSIDGLHFYGTPFTPTFYDWSFMKSEKDLAAQVWSQIPKALDFLITHGPPRWILDQNQRGDHCGSQTLADAIQDKKPRYHLFGHIHGNCRSQVFGATTFYNAALLSEMYFPDAAPHVIDVQVTP